MDHGLKCSEMVATEGPQRSKVVVQEAAAATELKKGDEVLKVGALTVGNRFDLERALWGHKAGETVEMDVFREGREVKLSLTLNSGSYSDAGSSGQPKLVSKPRTANSEASTVISSLPR